jgi:uncharacterized DUF497 family protein
LVASRAPKALVLVYIGTQPWQWNGIRPKRDPNLRKHGIRFADAVSALEDHRAISVPDDSDDEERWITIGMDCLARILVVVYTWRDEDMRLISARPAVPRESRQYEEGYEEGI